jgi:hypothetical protein
VGSVFRRLSVPRRQLAMPDVGTIRGQVAVESKVRLSGNRGEGILGVDKCTRECVVKLRLIGDIGQTSACASNGGFLRTYRRES